MAPTLADRVDAPVVDCDLHVAPDADAVRERLPARFRGKGLAHPRGNWASPADDPVGADPADLTGYLDATGVSHAVVTGGGPNLRAAVHPDARHATALVSAYNEWLFEEALTDDRLLGSVSVNPRDPAAAADEVRRWADRPDAAQVVLGAGSRVSLGEPRYWPLYEAAERAGLPVAVHVGSEGYGVANPNTGAGYPGSFVERRSVEPANCMGQLLSLVLEGVFVEFPDLRVVLVGGGYSWLGPFCWRLDKMWKGLTDDVPWLDRPPGDYLAEHVRHVTYPVDEAGDPETTARMLEMARAEETLLFGSNYPRRDGHAPGDDLPALDDPLARAILSGNATALYGL